ncbi:acyl carrier protein [Streptomyces lavendulae]|uniref:Acyl carrier protein n=1 Tax=Streptomyces lavendulae subsp. lavendulae TaxID=58340 RepID=A0A2K8PEC2_STRLA|nr:acyl carrier protein [Streptomyces lavendulae]ATZ23955.1 Acyl carrier protein [Streptomyces lavendulae subsp. lavendulae]QUQ53786.1 Acyl carrier protein [Streptomyces lavendulae subsp. lavendulae]
MSATRSGVELSPERKAQVKEIVCEVLEVDPAEVLDSTLFIEELDADSLRTIEMLAGLERTLGIDLAEAPIEGMVNLDGVYAVVAESEAK